MVRSDDYKNPLMLFKSNINSFKNMVLTTHSMLQPQLRAIKKRTYK